MKWLVCCRFQDVTVAGVRIRRGEEVLVECTEAEARLAERAHHGLTLTPVETAPAEQPAPEVVSPIGDEPNMVEGRE